MTSSILKVFNKPLTFEKINELLKKCPEYIWHDFACINRREYESSGLVQHRVQILKEEPETALINALRSGELNFEPSLNINKIQSYMAKYWFIKDQLPTKMDVLLLMSGSPESMIAPLIALPVGDTNMWLPSHIENLQFVGPGDEFGIHRNLTSDPQLLSYIYHILKT